MRAYFLCNSWLSGIQKGIQGTHALTELVNLHGGGAVFQAIFDEWATDHKTIIMLEGGNQDNLESWLRFLNTQDTKLPEALKPLLHQSYTLPYSHFREDKESLNECMTAIVILVSSKLCSAIDDYRTPDSESESIGSWLRLTAWEREFVETISKCRLAV